MTGLLSPSAQAVLTTNTWTNVGLWTNSATNWNPASGTAWDATSGSNSIALFTNTTSFTIGMAPTTIYLNGMTFSNTTISTVGSNNQIGQGTLNFQASGTTNPLIVLSGNSTLNIYSSIILTNTSLTITGGASGLLNLYASNNFGGGTLTEQGGNGFGIFNVYGTNYGGTYNLAGITAANTSSVAGLITNATAINAANTLSLIHI